MSKFSEESLLLIRQWYAYQDIMEAGERLNTELASVLLAIEDRIRREEWWNPNWQIRRPKEELQLTHSSWRRGDIDVISIGAEGFRPDGVFGSSPPPGLFVYISGKWPGLKQELQAVIQAKGEDFPGEMDGLAQNSYVIRSSLSKCLPEEIGTFEDTAAASVVEFLKFYVGFLPEFSRAVEKCSNPDK
jgi:hypothetical protein